MNSTKTQIDILTYLLRQDKPQSIRNIARETKKSYPLVYNNITSLEKMKVICKQDVPPAQIITISPQSPIEPILLAEEKLKEELLNKHKWLGLLVKDYLHYNSTAFGILILFGSYAKHKEDKSSDLDILIIVPDNGSKSDAEHAIKRCYTPVVKQALILHEKDFLDMIRNSNQFNVGNEVIKNHVILYGGEQYHQLLKRSKL